MGKNKGGAALAEALVSLGHTHAMAEELLGVTRGYVSHLIAGKFKAGRSVSNEAWTTYGVDPGLWDEPVEVPKKKRAKA
jgi:hypothetical protein